MLPGMWVILPFCTARGLFRTLAAMIAPCSVNTQGRYFRCWPRLLFELAVCDMETSSAFQIAIGDLKA